jgi:hypothetical protein
MKTVAQRLLIKPGMSIRVVGPDDHSESGGASLLGELPEGVRIVADGPAEAVVVYVETVADLRTRLPGAAAHAGNDGLLWLAYPKLSSGRASDLNRDAISPLADEVAGLTGVTLISIDPTWSAMRLRPSARYRA